MGLASCLQGCMEASGGQLSDACAARCTSEHGWIAPAVGTEMALCAVGLGISVVSTCVVSCMLASLLALDLGTLQAGLDGPDASIRRKSREVLHVRKFGTTLPLCTLLLASAAATAGVAVTLTRLVGPLWGFFGALLLLLLFSDLIPPAVCGKNALTVGAYTAWLAVVLVTLLFPLAWPISALLDRAIRKREEAEPPSMRLSWSHSPASPSIPVSPSVITNPLFATSLPPPFDAPNHPPRFKCLAPFPLTSDTCSAEMGSAGGQGESMGGGVSLPGVGVWRGKMGGETPPMLAAWHTSLQNGQMRVGHLELAPFSEMTRGGTGIGEEGRRKEVMDKTRGGGRLQGVPTTLGENVRRGRVGAAGRLGPVGMPREDFASSVSEASQGSGEEGVVNGGTSSNKPLSQRGVGGDGMRPERGGSEVGGSAGLRRGSVMLSDGMARAEGGSGGEGTLNLSQLGGGGVELGEVEDVVFQLLGVPVPRSERGRVVIGTETSESTGAEEARRRYLEGASEEFSSFTSGKSG